MYSLYYLDGVPTDGAASSRRVRHYIGIATQMSERAARREHTRIIADVNRRRGSVAPAYRGQTFSDIVQLWREAVAPNLSPATVRARESGLVHHVIPHFGTHAPHAMGIHELQQFVTTLRKTLSRKTTVNILGAIFAVFAYAARCGTRVPSVSLKDLELGTDAQDSPVVFFTREQAAEIIGAAREPYATLFAVAWFTGMRAGELLALNRNDLDFDRKTIRVNKSSDDRTREIRQPKTKNSVASVPMPSMLETRLRNYLEQHWRPNTAGLLFPNRRGTQPLKRANVVRFGLRPLLKKFGIPTRRAGLHAFRHGLATELANASVPIPVLQQQMRHADVKTTLRVYAHVIPASQREAMENVAIGTAVPIGTVKGN